MVADKVQNAAKYWQFFILQANDFSAFKNGTRKATSGEAYEVYTASVRNKNIVP